MAPEKETTNGTLASHLADHPRLVGALFTLLLVLNQGMTTLEGCGGTSTCGT